jgi:galactokinase
MTEQASPSPALHGRGEVDVSAPSKRSKQPGGPRDAGDPSGSRLVEATAPGRVNLIGDHTDYTGGLALPAAIDQRTTVRFEEQRTGLLELVSDADPAPASIPLGTDGPLTDPASLLPAWARYAAGVVAVLASRGARPRGGTADVRTELPLGCGLSSSAALEVALALALGFEGSALELARACQEAEHLAVGVPCGILDQLTIAAGVEGHALLLDARAGTVSPVPVPADLEILVVDSGERRSLSSSAYAARRAECEAAEAEIGSLAEATLSEVGGLADPVLRRRARHVVTENERVRALAAALPAGDRSVLRAAMLESHRSLAEDFEVSTPTLDAIVEHLSAEPGVVGARLTGAGFGGAVVALVERGALDVSRLPFRAFVVHPAAGASRRSLAGGD